MCMQNLNSLRCHVVDKAKGGQHVMLFEQRLYKSKQYLRVERNGFIERYDIDCIIP